MPNVSPSTKPSKPLVSPRGNPPKTGPLLSVGRPQKPDGAVRWTLWLRHGMPFAPDVDGLAPSRREALAAGQAWLSQQGVTTPLRTDGGVNARWWSRRTGAPTSRDPSATRYQAPRDEPAREHLEVLGVRWPVDERQLQIAWREKALTHHPDAGGDPEKFIKARTAFEHIASFVNGDGR